VLFLEAFAFEELAGPTRDSADHSPTLPLSRTADRLARPLSSSHRMLPYCRRRGALLTNLVRPPQVSFQLEALDGLSEPPLAIALERQLAAVLPAVSELSAGQEFPSFELESELEFSPFMVLVYLREWARELE